jgi:hypothetical protein
VGCLNEAFIEEGVKIEYLRVKYHTAVGKPVSQDDTENTAAIKISAGRTHCVEITSSGDGITSEDNLIRESTRSIQLIQLIQ